jgi:hypothetical protein
VSEAVRWRRGLVAAALTGALAATVFAAPALATTRAPAARSNGGGGTGGSGVGAPPSSGFVKATLGWITTYTYDNGVTEIKKTWGAIPGPGTPQTIINIIDAANQIAHNPYPSGGHDGHGCYGCRSAERVVASEPMDCSASVSWALHADGHNPGDLLRSSTSLDSGQFESWGLKRKGVWITVYANGGHAFMKIAGLWFDTAGPNDGDQTGSGGDRWSTTDPWETSQLGTYTVRHPKGW